MSEPEEFYLPLESYCGTGQRFDSFLCSTAFKIVSLNKSLARRPTMTVETLFRCLLLVSIYYHQIASKAQCENIQGHDCSDIWEKNNLATSGIYCVKPQNTLSSFQVYCEITRNGGWTLIQKHDGMDGLSFNKTWSEYKYGFGQLQGEHWLGLQNIYDLTHQTGRPAKLHISLGDFNGHEAYAEYNPFSIGSEANHYNLLAGDYSGTAGDAFLGDEEINGTNQYSSPFSTWDSPNDNCYPYCEIGDIMEMSCSEQSQAGWWFNLCGSANLNGIWRNPPRHRHRNSYVAWPTWRPDESLKFSKMFLIFH
ncbi:fibrinogen-like protein 1 [Engystomops pustulosus]|uniref:fibrinogen-like protein 1 n=1 Tax=Engystomops pustulosus TaxID=76066 RepID=UPI003AFA2619